MATNTEGWWKQVPGLLRRAARQGIHVDGQMCEEIRMGIHARPAFGYPKMWRRKDGKGFAMSFGSTVLDEAGGFLKFLAEWEEDPNS